MSSNELYFIKYFTKNDIATNIHYQNRQGVFDSYRHEWVNYYGSGVQTWSGIFEHQLSSGFIVGKYVRGRAKFKRGNVSIKALTQI